MTENNSEIMNWLFNYAFDKGVSMMFIQLDPYTPPATNVRTKRILMNSSWHNKAELPLQFAHEIGHIMLEQEYSGLLYYTPSKFGMEFEANKYAINLLLPFYMEDKESQQINIYDFMGCFSIPSHLEEAVTEAIRNY
ncbi:ImmA/IrrE family metallo-endopeptidase [Latilactobacillus curvatus]|uniref:ImmA/IrrE family metallo-endopeptidase n=1 Tax=Latilactobacillus curvatus TaxID=28038 RepID=UPI001647414E|nr:ImmA/IrrE family metallo-endopeptidase [Latilactobacillus curvatus]